MRPTPPHAVALLKISLTLFVLLALAMLIAPQGKPTTRVSTKAAPTTTSTTTTTTSTTTAPTTVPPMTEEPPPPAQALAAPMVVQVEEQRPPETDPPVDVADVGAVDATGATDGYTGSQCPGVWAIPVYIVWRESHCSYTALNAGSGAGGAYQMIPSTSNAVATRIEHPELVGVNASEWPPEIQDQAAASLWQGGAGCGHWSAC